MSLFTRKILPAIPYSTPTKRSYERYIDASASSEVGPSPDSPETPINATSAWDNVDMIERSPGIGRVICLLFGVSAIGSRLPMRD